MSPPTNRPPRDEERDGFTTAVRTFDGPLATLYINGERVRPMELWTRGEIPEGQRLETRRLIEETEAEIIRSSAMPAHMLRGMSHPHEEEDA